jgi:hypothetical protein
MTDLAKILLLKGLDSQEAKDYFQQTFEAIKDKELKLEYSSVNGITLKKEIHSTIKILDYEDMAEQINDIIESLMCMEIFGGNFTNRHLEEEVG